ncbi:hypothetical protein BOTBODRAFT_111901 [Botryobasidium botryosum FD-172 SS1]|uniref:DUF6830 domain-containing protein n=1 Tax=Botryobasidium botryosum (strain FD-172 SS1) TaxID=930990 RepID=A0A067MCE9_BOTB1|nr:hypothetical protein BOTBODRAFT_111901 [Botryobasidium botryosum FD-172 SS1]
MESPGNAYAPFKSELDWRVAMWAKTEGPGSSAFTNLLSIPGVLDALGLSFKNSKELNRIIDTQLPGRPSFKREEIQIGKQFFEIFYRDVIECLCALWGNPEFCPILVFIPERQYTDKNQTIRLFHDMHQEKREIIIRPTLADTGRCKWWWQTQEALEKERPGATIAPIIISDKTQLTVFGNKTAYPIYLTIGNLPKDIRRKPSRQGQILLAYLPTTRLDHMSVKASRRRALANLFHGCMRRILAPLKEAGAKGIEMATADGAVRRVHPIFACFVGDYPEQVLAACTVYGHCPKCSAPRDTLGDKRQDPLRHLRDILEVLSTVDGDQATYKRACKNVGIHAVYHPFWEDLPFANVYRSITPDVLHQLYQGVLKHLVSWLKSVFGEAEIDARCRAMPPNHNVRLFTKGISSLSRISGQEHRHISRILLGLIIDLPLPGGLDPARLVASVRAILDFLHLARYPVHSTETLALLDDALKRFHQNKSIFIDLGIRSDFNFPKLHSLLHYVAAIKLFGTTDNYNTEATERLHIDYAKDAYRATNRRDEYPQMTAWLQRREKVLMHAKFIAWRLSGKLSTAPRATKPTLSPPPYHLKMAKSYVKTVHLDELADNHDAPEFRQALGEFLVRFQNPSYTTRQVRRLGESVALPFQRVAVYHKIKFETHDRFDQSVSICDAVHARPGNKKTPARFDTVLVNVSASFGLPGTRVAQVRAVFTLPAKASRLYFSTEPGECPMHLAYVEWFTPFQTPERHSGLYKISRSMSNRERVYSVIPVTQICRSIHLYPSFGPLVSPDWTSPNVLDNCNTFYVSPFADDNCFFRIT